ncbi:MAG: bifunctional diaminohydroxyphosphoribosylaminopyrimidine deaminase/5-amino-6-(5-phosphoribosylamino)uracil reductase RibD [Bacteroidia bacterium]
MNVHEQYMKRCLALAEKALREVAPNPMVGCVIVYENEIIAEGYHQLYGYAHAEVNAINAVIDKELLKKVTLYVNLEPCSYFGKTPPCADLIIKYKIPHVVIGSIDTNSLISGQGIQRLQNAGIKTEVGILENECRALNKRFFTHHEKKRPYIILKWAQTADGFIDNKRLDKNKEMPLQISNAESKKLVHLWRSQEQAIIVGTNTALLDNPQLTVRNQEGKNPLRIVIDNQLKIPKHYHLLDKSTPTLIFTSKDTPSETNLEYVKLNFENEIIPQLLRELHQRNIRSLLVEGGEQLLNSFIKNGLWDEAKVFVSEKKVNTGVNAPVLNTNPINRENISGDCLLSYQK